MPRYTLGTLLILLTVVVALVATGALRLNQRRGVGRAIRELNRVAPPIEQHSQEVQDLAAP